MSRAAPSCGALRSQRATRFGNLGRVTREARWPDTSCRRRGRGSSAHVGRSVRSQARPRSALPGFRAAGRRDPCENRCARRLVYQPHAPKDRGTDYGRGVRPSSYAPRFFRPDTTTSGDSTTNCLTEHRGRRTIAARGCSPVRSCRDAATPSHDGCRHSHGACRLRDRRGRVGQRATVAFSSDGTQDLDGSPAARNDVNNRRAHLPPGRAFAARPDATRPPPPGPVASNSVAQCEAMKYSVASRETSLTPAAPCGETCRRGAWANDEHICSGTGRDQVEER